LETQQQRANWASIVSTVRTRHRRAAVIEAQRRASPDVEEMRRAYWRLLASGKYAHLDRMPLSASQLAELAHVYAAGPRGISANSIEGRARAYLARHRLTAPVPGCLHPADNWRAQIAATVAGAACVEAARGEPVELTLEEAVPLAVIERTGLSPGWPGTDVSLRVATTWRLVEMVRADPLSAAYAYRLTPAGHEALRRQRARGGRAISSVTQTEVELMREVKRVRGGDLGVLLLTKQRILQKCLEAGWVVERPPAADAVRPSYAVTEDGEDALSAFRAAARQARPAPAPLPTAQPVGLRKGMTVRLSNRSVRGVGPDWVTVERVETGTVGKRTVYEVWVTGAGRPEPYVYCGVPLHPNVKFQVQNA
jgi:hypothetical protein